jgi:hypothetical protein
MAEISSCCAELKIVGQCTEKRATSSIAARHMWHVCMHVAMSSVAACTSDKDAAVDPYIVQRVHQ